MGNSNNKYRILPEPCNEYIMLNFKNNDEDNKLIEINGFSGNGFGGKNIPITSPVIAFQDELMRYLKEGDFQDILADGEMIPDEIMIIIEGDINHDVSVELVVNSQSVEERCGQLSAIQRIIYISTQEVAYGLGFSPDQINTSQLDELMGNW